MTEVSQLLAQSLSAHHKAKGNKAGRAANARELWTLARELRLQAWELDPDFRDPAWGEERADHEVMMIFYQQQLGPTNRAPMDLGELGKTTMVPIPAKATNQMREKIEQARKREVGFELKDEK